MKLVPTPNLKKHPSGQQSLQERKQSTIPLTCTMMTKELDSNVHIMITSMNNVLALQKIVSQVHFSLHYSEKGQEYDGCSMRTRIGGRYFVVSIIGN